MAFNSIGVDLWNKDEGDPDKEEYAEISVDENGIHQK